MRCFGVSSDAIRFPYIEPSHSSTQSCNFFVLYYPTDTTSERLNPACTHLYQMHSIGESDDAASFDAVLSPKKRNHFGQLPVFGWVIQSAWILAWMI